MSSISERIATGLVLLLALLVPFDLESGLRVGPVLVTPWEVVLGLLFLLRVPNLLLRVPGLLLRHRARSLRMTATFQNDSAHAGPWKRSAIAGLLFLTAGILSAFLSNASLLATIKPVLRWGAAVLLLLIVWLMTLREPRLFRWIAYALASSVALAVGAGLLESSFGLNLEPILSPFRGQLTLNAGEVRLTGPFHHANEAAQATALTLVLLWTAFWSSKRRSVTERSLVLWWITSLLLATGLTLTLSRSGLVAWLIGWSGVAFFTWRLLSTKRLVLLSALTVPLIAFALAPLLSTAVGERYLGSGDNPFGVEYEVPNWTEANAGQPFSVPVTLHNTGGQQWPADGPRPVHLSYHLADAEGASLDFEGARTSLPRPVGAGQSVTIDAWVHPPKEPGEYTVLFDVVQEHVTWFSQKGNPTAVMALSVVQAGSGDRAVPRSAEVPLSARTLEPWDEPQTVSRSKLWPIALHFWRTHPLFGVGPDQFRHRFPERLPPGNYDPTLHANNLYLELAATVGSVGLGTYLLWLFTLAWIFWKRIRTSDSVSTSASASASTSASESVSTSESPSLAPIVAVGGLAMLGVFLAHGVFDTFLEPWAVQGLFALGLGSALGTKEDSF